MESQDNEKKKILYVITQGEWGGAQRYVHDLAVNAPDDWEVFVAVGEKEGKKDLQNKIERIKDYKIKIIKLKHLVRRICPWHDILAVFELRRLYKTLKPDVIHLNSSKAGIVGSLARIGIASSPLGTPRNDNVVYTVHGWVFNEPSRKIGRILYRWLEKYTAKLKDKIIVLSDRDYNDGVNLGIVKNKLVKIPLGIEKPMFLERSEARNQMEKWSNGQIDSETKLIGTIANLYKTKGLDILVEATKDSRLRGNDAVKFIIIGEGPEREKLQQQINKLQINNVHLLGSIENANQYLTAFDIFVLPSRKEGLPYTLLEALSANLPIIATNVGGIPEIIENEKTGLVSPVSSELLAQNLIKLISNKNLQEQFKQNPKPNYTLEKMLTATFSCYLHP